MAEFSSQEFYPDIIDKAAGLCWRLTRNHPLPDGNKRAAWAALVVFIDLNSGRWSPDPPDVDDGHTVLEPVGKIRETVVDLKVAGKALDDSLVTVPWVPHRLRFRARIEVTAIEDRPIDITASSRLLASKERRLQEPGVRGIKRTGHRGRASSRKCSHTAHRGGRRRQGSSPSSSSMQQASPA